MSINPSVAPRDSLGLELSVSEMYAPLRGWEKWIEVATRIRSDGIVQFSMTVNGATPPFPGLYLASYITTGRLTINKDFIRNYSGSWPVRIDITAALGDVTETATLILHDTRTMKSERVEITLVPSDRMQIPSEGFVVVGVASGFFDANDLWLPSDEFDWSVDLVEPVAGVELSGGVIFVSSMPHSNLVHVAVEDPWGTKGTATLTLFR